MIGDEPGMPGENKPYLVLPMEDVKDLLRSRFTLKEEIILRVLPEIIAHQLKVGDDHGPHAASIAALAALTVANATIAALEADE